MSNEENKVPTSTILTIKPSLLKTIVENYVRELEIEAENGEHQAKEVSAIFKDPNDYEDIEIPLVSVSIYF